MCVEESEDGSSQLLIFRTKMKGNARQDEVSPQGRSWTSIHVQYYCCERVVIRGDMVVYIYTDYLILPS